MEATFGERRKRPIFTLHAHAVALMAAAVVMLAPAAGYTGGSGPTGPSAAVKFEAVPGTDLKRVILTERAVERLGIQMGEVHEAEIIRTQIVGGRIVPPPADLPQAAASTGGFSGFAHLASVTEKLAEPVGTTSDIAVQTVMPQIIPPDLRRAWVVVTLSPDEWDRMQQDKPARILRLQTRVGDGLLAKPTGEPPQVDLKRTMLSVFYEVPGEDHGLLLNERVRVEIELADSGQVHKVLPYDAVWYDNMGKAWVYASAEHLVYVRMPIEIERIEGDLAVLKDGPPLGTQVVTTGAPLLYGAEVIYKR